MSDDKVAKLTDRQLRQLLIQIKTLDNEEILPLSDDEVAEIEAAYQAEDFPADREKRHLQSLEEMRKEWLTDIQSIPRLFSRVDELEMSREEFARRMQLSLEVLFKIEIHLIKDAPLRLARRLADELDVDIRSIVQYLSKQGIDLTQLAASSKGKPAAGRAQTWAEAISKSDMSDEDKKYWLGNKSGE